MRAALLSFMPVSRGQRNGTLFVLFLFGAVFWMAYRQNSRQASERLQFAIANMPRGIAVAEADHRIGSPPQEVVQVSGVLRNNMLLDAANSQAALYGTPQPYEVRLWRRGGVSAAVVVDQQGNVAGRFSWRDNAPRPGSFFESLSLADEW